MQNKGINIIFDIKRYAIHDGPGIRTTVFLKGCPLNCRWCHNPEGVAMEQEVMIWEERCIQCEECVESCPKGAISLLNDSVILDKRTCDLCGVCVAACPAQALVLVGKNVTVAQVMKEIEKDLLFYDESGGGVTFSGGEPLMQPVFLHDLLTACREQGIHTAVDTSGYTNSEILFKISKHVNLFLYDIKVMDDEIHRKFTGVSNKRILKNLELLSRQGQKIIVRVPLIPGINDDEKNILKLGEFVSSLNNVSELNILAYHRAGVAKFKRLKRVQDPFTYHPPSDEVLRIIEEQLSTFGLKIQIGG